MSADLHLLAGVRDQLDSRPTFVLYMLPHMRLTVGQGFSLRGWNLGQWFRPSSSDTEAEEDMQQG